MPKSTFAATAEGLPKFTRRAALTGLAATALTSAPAIAAEPVSPIIELVADYRFACEEHEQAQAQVDKIVNAMDAPWPQVWVGNLHGDGGVTPIYVRTHIQVDSKADGLLSPMFHGGIARAEHLRAKWHKELSEAEERFEKEAVRRGLREAERIEELAWDAKFSARDAVLAYPCQTVADYQARDEFVRELMKSDQMTDDVIDLVFSTN